MIKLHKNLIKGSLILLLAFGIVNFFHFIFQLIMARMLSISEYGTLAPLSAIIIIFLIFSESLQMIITKYSSHEKNKGKLKNLLKRSFKRAFLVSLLFYIVYIIISIPLSFILKINYLLMVFAGVMIFVTFFAPISRGIMQGKERFRSLGYNMIVESSIKLILGTFFVFIGLKVFGALAGIVLAGFIGSIVAIVQLKDILKAKEENIKTEGIHSYVKSTFLITALIVVFYSLDVIMAKIFFSPELAGSYAIASTLGKIIFWGTLPISKAMFPMSSENKENKENSENIFMNAFTILLFGVICALAVFYLFPTSIIKIFSGKIVPEAIQILFYTGLAFSIISFANLVILYKLSQGKIKGYYYLFIFILIEIFLLWAFRTNIFQFSIAFITASAIFLWGSIVLINE